MKFCPECGAAVSGGKFCSECGYRLQGEVTPSASAVTPPSAGIGFDLPDLGSFDALGNLANNCVAQDLARQEAEALAPFEVERHQNGKYAILALKDKSEMDIVVPSGVEVIGDGAFEGSDILTVVLPEGLRKIGDRAFADCEDLEEINFPKSLRIIGDEAFAGCANLDVEPPEGVRVGNEAFRGTAPELRREAEELSHREEAQGARERDLDYCYQQGLKYEFGKDGVERNETEAARLYRKAAELGHADSLVRMAMCNYYGQCGMKQNRVESAKWCRKAAGLGYHEGQFFLGVHYYYGDGVEQDKDEAVRLVRKAAEQGNERAQKEMYNWYKENNGAKIDEAEAVAWLHKAAEQGLNSAQNELGNLYCDGKGVERDLDKAEYWLSEAVKGNAYGAERDLEKVKKLKRIR